MRVRQVVSRATLVSGVAAVIVLKHASSVLSESVPAGKSGTQDALNVACFTAHGQLMMPADLAQWVFLGTSLGMGYNQAQFNPASPGQFQVVLMEPSAYRYFIEHGKYAPG